MLIEATFLLPSISSVTYFQLTPSATSMSLASPSVCHLSSYNETQRVSLCGFLQKEGLIYYLQPPLGPGTLDLGWFWHR